MTVLKVLYVVFICIFEMQFSLSLIRNNPFATELFGLWDGEVVGKGRWMWRKKNDPMQLMRNVYMCKNPLCFFLSSR